MYYVVNPDGSKYGPASKEMMQQWHREGRIAPDAWFEDAATEMRTPRSEILPEAPTTAPPVGQTQTYASTPQGYPHTPQGQTQAYQPQQHHYGSPQNNYGQQSQQYGQQQTYGQQQYGQHNAYQNNMYGNTAPDVPGKITAVPGSQNPTVAALLGFFFFIGGYIYTKQYVKGIALLAAAIVLFFVTGGLSGLVVNIFAAIDSYKIAERLNRGEAVDQWQFF